MATFAEPLRTERLVLRLLTADDLDAVHAYQRLPEVVEYMFWEVRSREQTREHLAGRLARATLQNDGDVLVVGVALPAGPQHPERLIGEITVFLHSVASAQAEIGWAFHPDFQGQGYALEAGERMLGWTFTELGAHRVAVQLDPRNIRSSALAERLGMRREALLRENLLFKGGWGDTAVYGMLRPEFDERHASRGKASTAPHAEALPPADVAASAHASRPPTDLAASVHTSLPPIAVAAVALIRDRRLLMVTARRRDVYYLPGGKIDPGESALDAVVRECREEVSVELDRQSIRSLFTISVQAHGEPNGRMVALTVFEAATPDAPVPSAEVDAVHWVTTADAHRCPPAGVETLRRLAELGLID